MGFRVLGRGVFWYGKRLGWGNKQIETTFGGISTKNLAEKNPKLRFFQPALQAHFQKMQQLGIRPTDVVCLGG